VVTWRELYHDEIERQAGFFETARAMGQTWLVVDGRTYDPTRMSREQVRQVATREAERLINYTINQENEAARKAGRVADKE
jgi:hypothetical protein